MPQRPCARRSPNTAGMTRPRHGSPIASTDEGVLACPEGAAAVAAAYRLRQRGWLEEHDEVVVFNTGSGLKYGEALPGEPEELASGAKIPRAAATSEEPFSYERAFQVRAG